MSIVSENGLQQTARIDRALAEATTPAETRAVLVEIDMLLQIARAVDKTLEEVNELQIARIRAVRQAGDMLAGLERGQGNRYTQSLEPEATSGSTSPYSQAYSEAQISDRTARFWQQVAAIPQSTVEAYFDECLAVGGEISMTGLLLFARKLQREQREQQYIPPPTGTYSVIYADPPWEYDFSRSDSRQIENQYPTLPVEAICALPIGKIAAPDAVLFLWATSPKLVEALAVVTAWGFEYKTCMVWDKEIIGMGYYARQQHELLLIATRGALPAPDPATRPASVLREKRGKHSKKPDMFYAAIEAMYPEHSKIELFSRNVRAGWEGWGFDYDGS